MGIVFIIAGYIIVAGIVAAVWDERHRYDSRWYQGLDSAFFVIFWGITVPVGFLYIMGRLFVYILLDVYDRWHLRKRRRRRR